MNNWIPTPEYPDYLVNAKGEVYSTKLNRKLTVNTSSEYPYIRVRIDGKIKRLRVDELVAKAFLPPPAFEGMRLIQRNGDTHCLYAHNLEWVTYEQWQKWRRRIQRLHSNDTEWEEEEATKAPEVIIPEGVKLDASQVLAMRREYDIGWRVPDLAEKYEVSRSYVYKVLRGDVWDFEGPDD